MVRAPPGGAAPAASPGCNAFFAAIFWGLAIVLAIVTAVHLVLAGGHFTVGIGVLRRRAWARILALVVSFFSFSYGSFVFYCVVTAVTQNGPPTRNDPFWSMVAGFFAVLFVIHAVLTWVVMFHPACAGEFRPAAQARSDYFREE